MTQSHRTTQKRLPRGIRNHNPGNIEYNPSVKWRGQIGSDGRFIQFQSPEYGIRAIVKILLTYQRKYRLKNITQIINRWAPPVENNTNAYIQAVAAKLAISATAPIDINDPTTARELVKAIISHENGQKYSNYYPNNLIEQSIGLAGIKITPRPKALQELSKSKRCGAAVAGATATVAGTSIALEQINDTLSQVQTAGLSASGLIAHLTDTRWLIWGIATVALTAFCIVIWSKYHDSRRAPLENRWAPFTRTKHRGQ